MKNGSEYRIISDYLGSVRLVVDVNTGQVVQQISYDEWGNIVQDTNPGFQPFGFAGGIHDRDSKLIRFGARDYDSETGRWTCKDPAKFETGTNWYIYCNQNPINLNDSSGYNPPNISSKWKPVGTTRYCYDVSPFQAKRDSAINRFTIGAMTTLMMWLIATDPELTPVLKELLNDNPWFQMGSGGALAFLPGVPDELPGHYCDTSYSYQDKNGNQLRITYTTGPDGSSRNGVKVDYFPYYNPNTLKDLQANHP
ncbi:MAG: RHS repeat-associated core domain-containing protein [Bacteroidota bacterium]|nr:RHS repeat-associated core domain-containing protein [Bacteroidota bacterium]